MAATVIRNFIAKALFKKKGAIANNKSVDFSANALEQRLKNFGIDPNAIQNENQLNEILAAVKQAEDQAFSQRFGDMLGGSRFDRQGEVFDMTGKKLDSSRGIMGGTQIDETSLKEGLMKTDNPFSDLVKTTEQGPKTLKQREAEVLEQMNKNNKETVQRIKNRKMVEEAIDNASPGFAGDRKYDAQLVADDLADKRFGKEFYDLDQRQQMDLYDEALEGLADQKRDIPDPEDFATGGRAGYAEGTPDETSLLDMIDVQASGSKSGKQQIQGAPDGITIDSESINAIIKADIPISQKIDLIAEYKYGKNRDRIDYKDQEIKMDEGGYKDQDLGFSYNQGGDGFSGSVMRDLRTGDDSFKVEFLKRFANGGRIGLKDGMDRRTFLKIMGGLASVPILGKFLKPAKVAGKAVKAAPVVSKSTPPAYFFELAEKIKTLGRVTDGPQERLKIHTMPAKDGKSELMLTEDIGTGEMQIKKISKEGDDMVTEVQTMDYTPGSSQADEATQGIPADSYDEYTEFNSRIIKDEYNDPDIVDGIKVDEIIEEVKDQAPSIKKAGGGIARMLGE